MTENPYPQINTILLLVLAAVSIYGLWLSWFNRVTIEILCVKFELLSEEHVRVKTENETLFARVNVLPSLIANYMPEKKSDE